MITSWLNRVLKSPFFRAVLNLSSATALSQIIVVAAMPLLTRWYSPAEFGLLAAFTGIAVTLLVISSLRYELAIPLQRIEVNANHLINASLAINFMVALVVAFLIFIFGTPFASLLGVPELSGYLWLVPFFLIFAGGYRIYTIAAIRKKYFHIVSKARIAQASSTVLFQAIGGLGQFGAWGLIGGFLIGHCVGVISLVQRIGVPFLFSEKRISVKRVRFILAKHSRFPKLDMPAAMADTLGAHLPSLLLASLFSPTIAGLYAVTHRLLSAPIMLISQTVGQVLLGAVADYRIKGAMVSRLWTVMLSLFGLIFFPTIFVFAFAEVSFGFVLGPEWLESGAYAKWIMLGIVTQFIYSPISVLLLATEGQHINLMVHFSLLITKIGAIICGYLLSDPLLSVIGVSLANSIGYFFAIIFLFRHVMQCEAQVNFVKVNSQ